MKLQFPQQSDEPQAGANMSNHISQTALWCVGIGIILEKSEQRATQTMRMSWESTAGVDYYRLLMLVCLLLWQGKYSMSPFCNAHRSLLEPGWEQNCTALCALNFGKKNGSLCHGVHMWQYPNAFTSLIWCSDQFDPHADHSGPHNAIFTRTHTDSTLSHVTIQARRSRLLPVLTLFLPPPWCEHLHHAIKRSKHLNTLPLHRRNGGGTKQNTAPATWAKGALVTGPKS